jgi:hypothetical protein
MVENLAGGFESRDAVSPVPQQEQLSIAAELAKTL